MGRVNDAGLAQIMQGVVAQRVRAKTRAVHADLVRETPVRTGRLRQGWRTEFRVRGLVVEGVITNRVTYLPYVIRGHGWIVPVRGRALRWVGVDGEVFARRVRPVAGNDFIGRVLARQSTGGWRFVRRGV